MGWNGSGKEGSADPSKMTKGQNDGVAVRKGLAGLCLVLVIAGATYFCVSNRPEAVVGPQTQVEQPRKIADVEPQIVERVEAPRKPTTAEVLRKKHPGLEIPDNWDKPYPPQAYRPDGSLMRHSRYVKVITNKVSAAMKSIEELTFENVADRDIAIALNTEPGELLVGDYEFGEKFVADFLESIKHPILPEKDDTEEQKVLKQWVVEAKKELKAKYDAGEDIAEIMNETRRQYKELGLYREELHQLVEQAKKDSGGELTDDDEADLVKAANKMLEERGCKPLALPDAFIEKLENEMNEKEESYE